MPTTPNPETHCQQCGEPLSIYGHCWQHDYPPMDPAQDKAPAGMKGGDQITPALLLPGSQLVFKADRTIAKIIGRRLEPSWCRAEVRWEVTEPMPLPHAYSLEEIRRHYYLASPGPYCNGQCGICSCISSSSTAAATPSK